VFYKINKRKITRSAKRKSPHFQGIATSEPRGAIQVREDAGSWLLVPVDWRWQSVCTRRGSSEVLSLRLADLRFGERRVVIA
jgi:hypothetical protein